MQENNSVNELDALRARYQAQADRAEGTMVQFYTGILMGIDIAAGATAQTMLRELQEQHMSMVTKVMELSAQVREVKSESPAWRQSAPTGNGKGTKDMNQLVSVYAIADPRRDEAMQYFYVGSSKDPHQQLKDYIRSTDVKVAAKPVIDEIIASGAEPTVVVLETGVKLSEADGVKSKHIAALTEEGHNLENQRR